MQLFKQPFFVKLGKIREVAAHNIAQFHTVVTFTVELGGCCQNQGPLFRFSNSVKFLKIIKQLLSVLVQFQTSLTAQSTPNVFRYCKTETCFIISYRRLFTYVDIAKTSKALLHFLIKVNLLFA